jgi:D-glycero-D-manno-heptose 1,7-bisphosphate phosphatase
MKRCVFFDRDGIVNRSPGPGWVERWEDFHLLPEFAAVARSVMALGYEVAIITNQRGVALGVLSEETLSEMHRRLNDVLISQGVSLLGIYICPHERDSCACRKPLPGLFLRAAEEHDIDLSASWMIGDKETDVVAGRNATCRAILVNSDTEGSQADHCVADMSELQSQIGAWL